MNERNAPRRALARALGCAAWALLGALLCGAQLLGGYAPFAVGAVAAAGPGWEGFAALIGILPGAAALLDFPHALRTVACGVLLFTANNAFCELRAYRRAWFLPLMTAGLTLAVEFVYILRAGSAEEAACCAAATALAALSARCLSLAATAEGRRTHPAASLVALLGVLAALASAQLESGLAPGRAAAALAVLALAFDREAAEALACALCIGLATDLAAPPYGAFLHTACYGLAALAANLLRRGSRVRAAGAFALVTAAFVLPLGVRAGMPLLYEGLAGTLAFLLLPNRALRALRAAPEEPPAAPEEESGRERLLEAASALRELSESVARTPPPPEENPAAVFDRAAEQVCRDCTLRELCWEKEYGKTYNALNDATAALLRNGQGRGEDFPSYFSDRCIRFPDFLAAVNTELRAFVLRRQYRARLDGAYARSAGQYARFSELLSQVSEDAAPAAVTAAPAYRLGTALRPRVGERVSGDCASAFETGTGELCLLLSDGMGSGEAARYESTLAVRLLERFLRAGVGAPPALRTLNSALTLRAERSDSFTTVDLLTLSLRTGEGRLYKYGAAPSYVKRGERVRRVSCSSLPAGLAEETLPPETTQLRLTGGSFFVMVTDGVAGGAGDAWLEELLAGWEGRDPQLLASAILADSGERTGAADDAGVLVLYLPGDAAETPREV